MFWRNLKGRDFVSETSLMIMFPFRQILSFARKCNQYLRVSPLALWRIRRFLFARENSESHLLNEEEELMKEDEEIWKEIRIAMGGMGALRWRVLYTWIRIVCIVHRGGTLWAWVFFGKYRKIWRSCGMMTSDVRSKKNSTASGLKGQTYQASPKSPLERW